MKVTISGTILFLMLLPLLGACSIPTDFKNSLSSGGGQTASSPITPPSPSLGEPEPPVLGGGSGGGTQTVPAPIVSSLSQNSVSTTGGEVLILIGSNFQNGATVILADLDPIATNFVDASHLQIVTPALPAGDILVRVINPDLQFGDLSGALTATEPVSGPGSVTKVPSDPSVKVVDNDMYHLQIPFESASSIIGFSGFDTAIANNAVITKVSARIHQYAKEDGFHFYFILNFGVKDMLVELYDSISGSSLSANKAMSQKIVSWNADAGIPMTVYNYTLLESLDGSAVISPAVLNQMSTGIRLQYYNEYYKSNFANVYIDQIELVVDYH